MAEMDHNGACEGPISGLLRANIRGHRTLHVIMRLHACMSDREGTISAGVPYEVEYGLNTGPWALTHAALRHHPGDLSFIIVRLQAQPRPILSTHCL